MFGIGFKSNILGLLVEVMSFDSNKTTTAKDSLATETAERELIHLI